MKQKAHLLIAVLAIAVCVQSFSAVKNIAHRGGALLAPENTLAAFLNAVALRADYLELDIVLSSDDSMMVIHDATVDRTTNGSGSVRSMTYAQLRTLDAGIRFHPRFAGERIPTFAEVLAVARSSAYNIRLVPELKSDEAHLASLVVAMVQNAGMANRVILSSFRLNQLLQVKNLDSTIQVQLFASASPVTIDNLRLIRGEWIGSDVTNSGNVTYAHSVGVLFNSWTINGAAQMREMIAFGVDAITTDNPQTLIAVLDSTPPSNVTLNSVTSNSTRITLNWSAAVDSQSGIAGYQIYRDINPTPTTLYTITRDTTLFVDETYTENRTFYYRVKAKNLAGLLSPNYSNERFATTGTDSAKPSVLFVTSRVDTGTVVVEFNERVDSVTATTKTNYIINKSVVVSGAKLGLDLKSVILSTTRLADTSYTINVKNVRDRAAIPNVMVTSNNIFLHKNLSANVVAYYKLDSLAVVGADTVVYDATANANNGLLKNGTLVSEGFLGNGLAFDGANDYVQFANSPSLNVGTVTLSVWANLAYLPTDMLFPFGPLFDSETDDYVLYEDRGNNELRFKVVTSTGAAERPGIPGADLRTGVWLHVVGVFDGASAKIYLNGILKDTHVLSGTLRSGQVAMLGKSSITGTPSYFKGSMDNIQVINRALSEGEIWELYTTSKTPVLPAQPSDVVVTSATANQTDVTLNWLPAANYESGLMYEIYRGTTPAPTVLVATVAGNRTTYVDKTNTESRTFYYRVKGKNTSGLKSTNYSNEVPATTSVDATRPVISFVTSRGDTSKVIVEFSEMVNQVGAETITNYSMRSPAQVLSAKLALDAKSVIVSTSPLTDSVVYSLTVRNIRDRAAVPNTMIGDSVTFLHRHSRANQVARYTLDEVVSDSVVVDASRNGNNGVLRNGVVLSDGLVGNALRFDGVNDFVQFAASPSFDIGGPAVSLSVWTKLDLLPAEAIQGTGPLFDSQGDEYVMYEDRGNRELRFKATNATAGAARPGIPEADLISGQWIHCVGVYDGVNAVIYYNGVRKGSLALTGNIRAGQVAMLGRSATSGVTSYFQGAIDNVEVFNKALSQVEVTEMYNTIRTAPLSSTPVTGVDAVETLPTVFSLSQNYPNPFNPTTNIKFAVPQNSNVKIVVYDIVGREVATLVNASYAPGFYTAPFDGSKFASGVYIYRMTSRASHGDAQLFTDAKKLMMLK